MCGLFLLSFLSPFHFYPFVSKFTKKQDPRWLCLRVINKPQQDSDEFGNCQILGQVLALDAHIVIVVFTSWLFIICLLWILGHLLHNPFVSSFLQSSSFSDPCSPTQCFHFHFLFFSTSGVSGFAEHPVVSTPIPFCLLHLIIVIIMMVKIITVILVMIIKGTWSPDNVACSCLFLSVVMSGAEREPQSQGRCRKRWLSWSSPA